MKHILNLKSIKAIIFDLDGVLFDSTNSWIKVEERIAKKLKVSLPKKEIHWQLFGKSAKERMTILFPKHKEEAISLFFGKERQVFLSGFKLFPDTRSLLKFLKNKNLKTAIATGIDKNALNMLLDKNRIWKLIDTTITSEEIKKEKPDPSILLEILKKFKLKSREVLYIGDATSDIETAKKAGIKVIIVTRGAIRSQRQAKKLGANYIFRNFSELRCVIK